MNPLLTEYNRRCNSTYVPTRLGAGELLRVSLHEAGHWMAFAHFKIPVVSALVDRRSYIGSGYVTPTALFGLVPPEKIAEVDYIATVVGPGVQLALKPFVGSEINKITAQNDIDLAKKILERAHAGNLDAQKSFKVQCIAQTKLIIYQNWPIIEALAYELMAGGRFDCGQCGKIEMRYGIGRHNFTPAKLKSGQQRLAAFHSSPDELLAWLIDRAPN